MALSKYDVYDLSGSSERKGKLSQPFARRLLVDYIRNACAFQ